ncbi:MAG: ATP-binding protein [Eubacteriaceae bacterium]
MEIENNNVTISLTLPNAPEYVSLARLTLTGIANRMGFNIDDIEDLKVAISEACTNALKHGCDSIESNYIINYTIIDEKIIIDVCDSGKGINIELLETPDLEKPKESGLGLYIINTLMDEVKVISKNNDGTTIRMIKKLER